MEEHLSSATSREEEAAAKEQLAGLTGLQYERCADCSAISTLPSFFRATRRGALCPSCQAHALSLRHAGLLAVMAVLLFLLLPAIAWNARPEFGTLGGGVVVYPVLHWSPFMVFNPLLVLALAAVLIVPHEFSHAAAALLAKGRALEIQIFEGPVRWQAQLGDTRLVLGSYPLTGHCVAVFPQGDRLRERTLLMVGAGPLFNVLVILALLPFYDGSRLTSTGAWPGLLIIANAVLLFSALLPFRASPRGGQDLSDGLRILHLVTGKGSEEDLHLAYLTTEAVYLLRSGRYAQAIETCDRALALYPAHTSVENTRAAALLETGHHTEALAIFEQLLARIQSPDPLPELGTSQVREAMEALLVNNVAYGSLLSSSGMRDLQRARNCARRAYRMAPWIQAIRGTWGAVLIETGDVEEGLVYVSDAAREAETPRAKAVNLSHAAIGYHRLGRTDEAMRLLCEARHLDPASTMVKRAEAEMAPVV